MPLTIFVIRFKQQLITVVIRRRTAYDLDYTPGHSVLSLLFYGRRYNNKTLFHFPNKSIIKQSATRLTISRPILARLSS